jgi:hypothetical protein
MKNFILLSVLLCSLCFSNNSKGQQLKQFNDNTAITKKITTSYFNAYMDLDFETMKKLMHKDISFFDPTSKFIFGSVKVTEKEKVYKNFLNNYSSIVDFKKSNLESFFSSNTGVFKFNISWSYKDANNNIVDIKNLPIIVVLTVENNKVIKHVDYGDYNLFISQITQQNK